MVPVEALTSDDQVWHTVLAGVQRVDWYAWPSGALEISTENGSGTTNKGAKDWVALTPMEMGSEVPAGLKLRMTMTSGEVFEKVFLIEH